jgi:hypothetical protein
MSARYYIFSTVLVVGVTLAVCVWKEKRSRKEILQVLGQVTLVFVVLMALVVGLAKLLEILGVAQAGFNL